MYSGGPVGIPRERCKGAAVANKFPSFWRRIDGNCGGQTEKTIES